MTKDELLAQKAAIQTAITNILEGGQEFQTRNARVKMPALENLQSQLSEIDSELSSMGAGTNSTTVLLKYGGCR